MIWHHITLTNLSSAINILCNRNSRIVLPGMLSRKRGSIVNIGSAAGVSASPLLAQYGAAKSYIAMLSKGEKMQRERKGGEVD